VPSHISPVKTHAPKKDVHPQQSPSKDKLEGRISKMKFEPPKKPEPREKLLFNETIRLD
jgi:hypothetical protein